jgi:hypothetical protein
MTAGTPRWGRYLSTSTAWAHSEFHSLAEPIWMKIAISEACAAQAVWSQAHSLCINMYYEARSTVRLIQDTYTQHIQRECMFMYWARQYSQMYAHTQLFSGAQIRTSRYSFAANLHAFLSEYLKYTVNKCLIQPLWPSDTYQEIKLVIIQTGT